MSLTKRVVDAAQPEAKDHVVWDGDIPGLGLKVTPLGAKVYFLKYRVGGRQRVYTIGRHGAVTPDEARKEALRLLAEVAKGNDPAERKLSVRRAPTVAEVAERYLAEHAEFHKKPGSVLEDRRLLGKMVLPVMGARKISDITRKDVQALHHDLRKTPYQANRVLALLSKMFNLAEKWDLREDGTNPCRHAEKYKEKKRERFLSDDELSRLGKVLSEVEETGSEMPQAVWAIRLLLATGARLSEILKLTWDEVDLDRRSLFLGDSKTGRKTITLSNLALEFLKGIPREPGNPHVIPGRIPGAHLVGLPKIWGRIRARAGLPGLRIHDLRHTWASLAAGAGFGLPIIGAVLGHREAATTARYAHLAQDPQREATNAVAARLLEAFSRVPRGGEVVPIMKAASEK